MLKEYIKFRHTMSNIEYNMRGFYHTLEYTHTQTHIPK